MPKTVQTAAIDCSAFAAPLGFEFLEKLGEGAHGVVYRARRLQLDDIVAVKCLKDLRNNNQLQRFRAEAEIVGRLQHPHIARALLCGVEEGAGCFIVYEYVDGETLKERLSRRPLTDVEFVAVFSQLLSALAYAHAQGLVHRDVKPSNIMLTYDEDGVVSTKLLDFGIVKDLTEKAQSLTLTSEVVGTPEYMSPEQCTNQTVDERSDLYSVATVMYECLTGEPPLRGENPMHSLYRQINESALPLVPRCTNLNISRGLAALVDSTLSKDRQSRPATAAVMLQRLESEDILSEELGRKSLSVLIPIVCLLLIPLAVSALCLRTSPPTVMPEQTLPEKPKAVLTKRIGSVEQMLHSMASERVELSKPTNRDVQVLRSALSKRAQSFIVALDKGPRIGNGKLCAAAILQATLQRDLCELEKSRASAKIALDCCMDNGHLVHARLAMQAIFNYAAAGMKLDKRDALEKIELALGWLDSETENLVSSMDFPERMGSPSEHYIAGQLYAWRGTESLRANPVQAERDLRKARAHFMQEHHVDNTLVLVGEALIELYNRQGKTKEAAAILADLRSQLDEDSHTTHRKLGSTYRLLAGVYDKQDLPQEVMYCLDKSCEFTSEKLSDRAERATLILALTKALKQQDPDLARRKLGDLRDRHPRFTELATINI